MKPVKYMADKMSSLGKIRCTFGNKVSGGNSQYVFNSHV